MRCRREGEREDGGGGKAWRSGSYATTPAEQVMMRRVLPHLLDLPASFRRCGYDGRGSEASSGDLQRRLEEAGERRSLSRPHGVSAVNRSEITMRARQFSCGQRGRREPRLRRGEARLRRSRDCWAIAGLFGDRETFWRSSDIWRSLTRSVVRHSLLPRCGESCASSETP